jgi:uncharacterized SAM-binding protein YcdF (DUF218 family)
MKTLAESLVIPPMVFLWMFLVGFALRSRPLASQRVYGITAIAFLVSTFAITGKLALLALLSTVPVWDESRPDRPVAIVVPTGGIYSDGSGKWWASSSSVRRMIEARPLWERLQIPLVLSGGSTQGNQPSEAVVVARQLELNEARLILETSARNSMETAGAVAEIVKDFREGPVLLITSDEHAARMAAVLRHAGIAVVRPRSASSFVEALGWTDFLPTADGLSYAAGAAREYWGILWYVLAGHISVTDLF